MKNVERHKISSAPIIEKYIGKIASRIPGTVQLLKNNPSYTLGVILADGLEAVIYAECAGRPHAETIQSFRDYKAMALSNFRFGAGNVPFSEKFYGEEVDFTPQRKTAFMSVDFWEQAYDACMLLRDMDGLKFLALVPEEVFVQSDSGASTSDLSYYRFLAHFFNGGKDTGKLLINAFEEAMKPQSNPGRTKFVELVRIPILDLMQTIVEGDNAKFNDYLVEALEGHKKYYGTKENAMATPGWLSMRILATCAMAVDAKGFAIEVESDYIPRWLYMGEGIK
jgi:hypothetical protein